MEEYWRKRHDALTLNKFELKQDNDDDEALGLEIQFLFILFAHK